VRYFDALELADDEMRRLLNSKIEKIKERYETSLE
jgi:hypothetical protein